MAIAITVENNESRRAIQTSADRLLQLPEENGGSAPVKGELKSLTIPYLDVYRASNYSTKQERHSSLKASSR